MKSFYSEFKILLSAFTLSFLFSIQLLGQTLEFSELNYSDAVGLAKKNHKLIFIQLEGNCDLCNRYGYIGLSGDEIINIFNNFICIKVGYNTEDYVKINSKFHLYPGDPSSIIINEDQFLLSSLNNQSTSYHKEYITLAAKAMANVNKPPFRKYEIALSSENINKELLTEYISILTEGHFDIQNLVEKYLDNLTIKELSQNEIILFFIRTCPIINSKVYNFLHLDNKLYSDVFMRLPESERIALNQKTISKSKAKAFREKDSGYIYVVSNFLRNTYENNYKEAFKATSKLEMDFYRETKDFKQYFLRARNYYLENLDKLDMDSIRKIEMNRSIKRPDGTILKGGNLYETADILNTIAFTIFENSTDKEQLGFALKLSAKTLDYNVISFYDTYAQILYRLGGRKDAIEWQEKAVNLSDSLNIPIDNFKETLLKMRNNSL